MPELADETLLQAVDVARAALIEITPADTIGEPVGHIVEGEHVVSLLFDCLMTGYPGWHWTVSLSRIDGDSQPSVLETELMPGGEALLAPEWVPWSDRLADHRTAQELAEAEAAAEALDALDEFDVETDEADALDEDDEFEDEDGGDDELDGIDFGEALAASPLNPGEAAQAEAETDDGTPDPPFEAASGEFDAEDDRDDEDD
ncbi:Protein of unknown function [Cryobacterium psychrotolerans]|uniref:Uncharacterized protein n=1 Tax=Cryobacterium psychrotolerans TaxID=386301 RepID=A0A1G9ADK3_9MICO|nr:MULTISPECIES: DUF3027 domain-containing protein [Cryobacterium]TFD49083.1 DUF3027 domain-containing protein [Cryobacterium sp. TMT1-2-1]TFD89726.1 DUF3027 domain-containing protein [Cryobacterium psychrotolerans]SDK24605.1 Protein of unknown function [Cryobacterium psychrotolerans]